MGNAFGMENKAGGHSGSGVSLRQNIDIDLSGVIRQCQAFCESIEQQTAAALGVLGSQHAAVSVLKETKAQEKSAPTDVNFAVDQLEVNQITLTHQMKGLQTAGDSFKQLVQPFREGIFPVNLKLPNEDILVEKEKTITDLNAELACLKTKLNAFQREAREKEDLKRANDELQREARELKNNIESVKRTNTHFQKDIEKSDFEKDLLRTKNNSLSSEMAKLRSDMLQLERRHRCLEQEHAASRRSYEDLRKQLEAQRHRKLSVQVQLFSPRKGDLATVVLQEMRAMLETQCSAEDRLLTVSICENCNDIQPDLAVLILCINASRLGSDVASALQGLTPNKCQGLVILHHKDTHALPNQPSERLLTSSTSDYKKLGGIFDMAFLSGKGIYPCDMNNRTVSELVNFIKAFSPAQ